MILPKVSGIKIKRCKYGRGVFAEKNFKRGDVIEVCPLLILPETPDNFSQIFNGLLERYVYDFDGKRCAIAFGYGSLYNHSKKPNAEFEIVKKTKQVIFRATKNIKKNSQILIDYGYDPATLIKNEYRI